jgi:hypothetical protein
LTTAQTDTLIYDLDLQPLMASPLGGATRVRLADIQSDRDPEVLLPFDEYRVRRNARQEACASCTRFKIGPRRWGDWSTE